MNPYLDFKRKAAARLARYVNDPEGLLEYLRPLQETAATEHQRLRPALPRATQTAPAHKPLAPEPAPKAHRKK